MLIQIILLVGVQKLGTKNNYFDKRSNQVLKGIEVTSNHHDKNPLDALAICQNILSFALLIFTLKIQPIF